MRSPPQGRAVAPSYTPVSSRRGSARGGKILHHLQSPSAVQRRRLPLTKDYRRGFFNRSAALLLGDSLVTNKKPWQSQKPKTMPYLGSQVDLYRSMANLSLGEANLKDLKASEKGDWDGEDMLAMQLLTIGCFDDLSPYNEDSGCGSSRSSSVSSGCRTNSWENLGTIFGPSARKADPESLEFPNGLAIKIDLGTTIRDFQTAVLPYGDISMFMQNRSQYHRLDQPLFADNDHRNNSANDKDDNDADEEETSEFMQVKCACCSFFYTMPRRRQ